MTSRFHPKALLAATAALGTALTLVGAPTGSASAPDPTRGAKQSATETARADAAVREADRAQAARDVGAKRTAGVWYDAQRERMVVNVTTAAAAREVRRDGLTARRWTTAPPRCARSPGRSTTGSPPPAPRGRSTRPPTRSSSASTRPSAARPRPGSPI